MLRSLRVHNFKAWRDTGPLKLAPLTLLFGSNSSGKSSINHFLMMLRQTMRSPDRNSVFDFGDVNAAVRLGSFRDVVFRHDLAGELDFMMEWKLPTPMTVRDPRSRRRYTGDLLDFRAKAAQPAGRRTVQSEGFEYRLSSGDETSLAVSLNRDRKRPTRWRLVGRFLNSLVVLVVEGAS